VNTVADDTYRSLFFDCWVFRIINVGKEDEAIGL